ncbi:hypothetical protein CEP53_013232 [Fusarium sp. AF-6]|nr:hypothetical protein CEP53_013232 [Fusarium sp. AF-6]
MVRLSSFLLGTYTFASATSLPRSDLKSCLEGAVGGDADRAQFPTEDPFITKDAKYFNLNLKYKPAAVMYPQKKHQVAEVVKCAAKYDKKVQARSGGRDFINKCLGGADGVVVVDLKDLNTIQVDQKSWVATVGPGNKLRSLVEGLNKNGKRFIPHGASPTVGVGGLLMVGGVGLTTREHGLSIDKLEQIEVVLANGTIVIASEKHHPDLLGDAWGRRKFRYCHRVQYNFTSENPSDVSAALKAYNQILRDPNLSRKVGATSNLSGKTFFIIGGFFGSEAEYKALNLEGRLPKMSAKRVVFGNKYFDFFNSIMEFAPAFPESANMYTKDIVVRPSTMPTNASIDAFINYIATADAAGSNWNFIVDIYGGASNDQWANSQSAENFIDAAIVKFQDNKPNRYLSYAGVPNYSLRNAQATYWVPNLARLEKIKSRNVIVALYPKPDGLEPPHGAKATYPSYDAATVQSCWICAKFAEYLKDHDGEGWQAWLQGPLTNVFRPGVCTLLGDKSPDPGSGDMQEDLPVDSLGRRKLRVTSMFVLRYVDGEEAGCQIQLNFLRDIDFQGPDIYASQKSPPGVDIELVREWIEGCEKDHKDCVSSHRIWYPTRLLDLNAPEAAMKLIISKETPPAGPYVTLSHRWGNHVYEQLTSHSEGRFKTSIDISTLPRVFQDAINMTRRLNVRYLWVDSLCIKQDKECGDWQVEALQMGNVYAHSYLNLSASYATEGNDPPLFAPEPLDNTYPGQLVVERDGPWKKDYVLDGDIWQDEVLEAPLMRRGWVFQERFLAPRVLHFGKRQLAWECNGLDALEMFPHGLPRGLGMFPKQEVHLAVTLPKESTTPTDFCEVWHSLVSKYSACSLTFPSDKLVAFAGVAKMIEACRKDRYIAGAWQSTFLVDLAWFLTEDREGLTPISETVTRAPSWSWLSLDGEICFYPQHPWADNLTLFASVLDIPASASVGSSVLVAHGAIRMKALLLQVEDVIEESKDAGRTFTVFEHEFEQGPSPESTHLDPDRPESDMERLVSDGNLWFVPLYASQVAIVAILVSAIGEAGDYRRVGAAQIQCLKTPHKSEGPHLDGWTPLVGSSDFVHEAARNLYLDIQEKLKDGEADVFNLI